MTALITAGVVTAQSSQQPAASDDTIGVLLVHGIGDQGRFQFLDETVRSLAIALTHAEIPPPRVSVSLRASGGSLVGAAAQTLREDGGPAAEIVVRRGDGTIVRFAIHEAWWGDVIEPATLFRPFFFFAWGLAMWAVPLKNRSGKKNPGKIQGEPHPQGGRGWPMRLWIRVQLFLVCYLIVTLGGFLSLTSAFLRIVLRQNFPDLMLLAISYMSDIKLYTQSTARRLAQTVPLDWAGQHARFAIRARAIRGITDMALRGYPQWWVMGHSMGSVVGFSALTTPDARLPRYIDEETWNTLKERGYVRSVAGEDVGSTPIAEPAWLEADEGIDRAKLFENLQGLVTFGSPLDKFAYIWPATVSVACDQKPLAGKYWLNVHDVTDPVAGALDAFAKAGNVQSQFTPTNLGYAASRRPLYSHLCYLLTPRKDPEKGFGASLVRWWLDIHDGATDAIPETIGPRWARTHPLRWGVRRACSWIFWLAMTGLAPLLTAILAKIIFLPAADAATEGRWSWWKSMKAMIRPDPSWWAEARDLAIDIASVAAAAVLVCGVFAWLYAFFVADRTDIEADHDLPTGGGMPPAPPATAESRMN